MFSGTCVCLIVSLLFISFVHYYYSSSRRVFLSARGYLKIIFPSFSLANSLITQREFSFSLYRLLNRVLSRQRDRLFFFVFIFFSMESRVVS